MGKSKYSKAVKQDALSFGYYDRVKEQLKGCYFGEVGNWTKLVIEKRSNMYTDCAVLLVHSQKAKRWKVHQKVREIIDESDVQVFVTLTWDDKHYYKHDTDGRRRIAQRWLKRWCNGSYMANLDINENVHEYVDQYGEVQTSQAREHYHCLIAGRLPKEAIDDWREHQSDGKNGIDLKEVHHGSQQQVANYIVKLGLHALKSEALDKRIIYSRKTA